MFCLSTVFTVLDKFGRTTTPFVIGRTRLRWQSMHIDLNSSIESLVTLAYFLPSSFNIHGSVKWIMVYQDHLTKFVVIRPLTPKRAAEVAYQLMNIFLLFGARHILQSDNGSELRAQNSLDKIGRTTTPFVIGRTRLRWQSMHIDLNSSIESLVTLAYFLLNSFTIRSRPPWPVAMWARLITSNVHPNPLAYTYLGHYGSGISCQYGAFSRRYVQKWAI
jgi:hypothetical protein